MYLKKYITLTTSTSYKAWVQKQYTKYELKYINQSTKNFKQKHNKYPWVKKKKKKKL